MSKNARRRLIKTVNKVDYKNRQIPYWITFTYPKSFPTESKEYKADLEAFFKRLKRAFGRIDYMETGIFKSMVLLIIILFCFCLAQRFWDGKDEKHLRAGANCKRIKAYRQLISYVPNIWEKQIE